MKSHFFRINMIHHCAHGRKSNESTSILWVRNEGDLFKSAAVVGVREQIKGACSTAASLEPLAKLEKSSSPCFSTLPPYIVAFLQPSRTEGMDCS